MIDPDCKIGLAVRCAFAVRAPGLADGKFISAEAVLGPKISRTNAVRAAEQPWRFLRAQRRQVTSVFEDLVRLSQGDADVPRQRIISRHAFIGSLQDDHILLPAQRIDDRRFRKWPEHIDVDRADPGIALAAQIIARGLNVLRRATQRHKHRFASTRRYA